MPAIQLSHGQEAPKRTCRILFIDRPANAPTQLQLFDGRKFQKVDLPKMNFSAVYELPAKLQQLSLMPQPVTRREDLPVGAPSVRVPEGATDFYLLLFSDPANKVAPVRMHLIDVSELRLEEGQILWINMTDLAIGGRLGEEKIQLKPQSKAVMLAPREDAGEYPVEMAYRRADSDHIYPICETRWSHNPRARSLGFIAHSPGVRTPRVYLIADVRAPKGEPTEAADDVALQE